MQNIYIKNERELEYKIDSIKQDGKDSLHVIADFDRTLSSVCNNKGEEEDKSLFIKFRLCANFGEDYNKKYDALYDKYYPIEIDESLSLDYRSKMMDNWWQEYVDLDIQAGSNLTRIEKTLDKLNLELRHNIFEFFEQLQRNDIPLLIFSGGIKPYISGFLKRRNITYKNISIIANDFEFDKDGKLLGYKGKIIHTFNKNEAIISHDSHFKTLKEKQNIILLGDHIGDLKMAEGLPHKTKITIGFYNAKNETNLQKYIDSFDIVICNDGPMDYVNNLLRNILQG
jgi:5'-nucleotidase